MAKSFMAVCGDEEIRTVFKDGEHRVGIEVCIPNDWNPNHMDPIMYDKTKLVVKETLEEAKRIPPIVCRPHPKAKRKLQIIDGFHRWKIMQDLGHSEIDVCVVYVSKQRAMSMTAELNYNRGEPDMEKYPEYLSRMIQEHDLSVKYLSERLPDSEDEIKSYLEAIDFEVSDVTIPDDDEDVDDEDSASKDASDTDALLKLEFVVRQGAAEVVEREIARLSKKLSGKNIRGRALEMMAVQSSQTTAIGAEQEDEDEAPKKRKRLRKQK